MKNILNIITSAFIILALPSNSLAAHGPTQTSAKASALCADVNQLPTLDCATAPSAIFSNAGRLWAAWSYAGHVYVNYSDDNAESFSPPVSVNLIPEKISAHGENRPKIALNNRDDIYVSWTTPLKKRFSGHVRFSYSTNNAKSFSTPVTVNDNLEITGHRFEALSVAENGNIYLAWLDKRDRLKAKKENKKYHGAAVYYTWSDNGGKNFYKNKKLIDHSCECCRVAMDTDSKNMPVVLWRNIYDKNTRDHTLVSFDTEDQPAKPIRVSFDNWQVDACPHHGPDLSVSEADAYHLVWFNNGAENNSSRNNSSGNNSSGNKGLFYSRINKDKTQTAAYHFGNNLALASHPNVIHKDKQVWITWKEFDGKKETIWSQYSSDNGDNWQKAIWVASTLAGSDYPFLLANENSVYIQWKTNKEGFKLFPIYEYTEKIAK